MDRVVGDIGQRLALGTVQWGTSYGIANRHGQPPPDEVARILARAKEEGIHVVDTARVYGGSEAVIGSLTARDPGWRVVTKLAPGVHVEGMAWSDVSARVADSLCASRRALRRTHLDTLLLHRFSHRHALGGSIWRALRERRSAGEIARLGVSVGSVSEAWDAIADPEVEAVQVPASLLDTRLWRAGFFEQALARDTEVFVRSVFLQGVAFLAPGDLPPALSSLAPVLARIRRWAQARALAPGDVFLIFMKETVPARLVLGCETAAQLDELLTTWKGVGLDASAVAELADMVPEMSEAVLNPARW